MLSTLRTLKLERCLCWWPNEISTLTRRDPDGHQPLTSTFIWCRFRNVYDGGEWNACHLNIIIWSEGALANLSSITKCHRPLIHFVQVTNHVLWRNMSEWWPEWDSKYSFPRVITRPHHIQNTAVVLRGQTTARYVIGVTDANLFQGLSLGLDRVAALHCETKPIRNIKGCWS